MIISEDGYTISYNKTYNDILIILPQTKTTITNTIGEVVDRKVDISQSELTLLLNVARLIFKRGAKE